MRRSEAMCERDRDAMSEVSESTTASSRASVFSEELHEFAHSLGLTGPDQLHHDRFRVDRRRLEAMIRVKDGSVESAEQFFQRIMDETCTHVSWPSRLKIGAKSKKDPHVRISGKEPDVAAAKYRVMAMLDTRSNRVTMKLDVSYTDHSHIIGRGGLSIKSVMDETGCHIHFPDSNRNNPNEKSNQVSIAGEIDGVERARARVRELTPLIFSFELPVVGCLGSPPDAGSPYIAHVQDTYNVQVLFRTRPKLHSTLVLVKGCEWDLARVKEATLLLAKHMCDNLTGQVTIHMMMEISPQHHIIVAGKNYENLRQIMRCTGAKILFPDAQDPNIPPLKRSNVTISGGINNVYLARQQLIGMLPLLLTFDVAENSLTANMPAIDEIMNNLEVVVQMRNKPKQNVVSVSIKGLEKNASNIYEARRQLLGLSEPSVIATIPPTYNGVNQIPASTTGNSHTCNMDFITVNSPVNNGMYISPIEVNWNQLSVPQQLIPNQHQMLMHQLMPRGPQQVHNTLGHSLSMPDIAGGYSSLSSTTSPLSSPCASPRNASPIHNVPVDQKPDIQNNPGSDSNLLQPSGYDQHKKFFDYYQLKMQATQAVQGYPKSSDLRVPTSSWSGYGFSQSSPSAVLNELKQKDKDSVLIQPNDGWAKGSLFSPAATTDLSSCSSPDLTSASSGGGAAGAGLSASNYLEGIPSGLLTTISEPHDDLPTLLVAIGLDKYTQVFKSHEIDLPTFQTLTETDLKEIGVTAFGARRKMLLCIAELNKRPSSLRYNAAVGAERKHSSSTNSLNDIW